MATAAETTAPSTSISAGWLDPFLEAWRPGTGKPRAIREPADGCHRESRGVGSDVVVELRTDPGDVRVKLPAPALKDGVIGRVLDERVRKGKNGVWNFAVTNRQTGGCEKPQPVVERL